MRLIDARDVKKRADCYPKEARLIVANILSHTKTAKDAVKVVRCKDCRHYRKSLWEGDMDYCANVQDGLISFPGESDYCSRGERKGEKDEANDRRTKNLR